MNQLKNERKYFFKIILVIITFIIFLISFPVISVFFNLYRDRDVVFNSNNYKKRNIKIDSLEINDNEGSNSSYVYGYSSELNNFKTTIYLGSIEDSKLYNEIQKNKIMYVWYNSKSNKAYPSYDTESRFPLIKFLTKKLKLPLIWVLLIITSITIKKLIKWKTIILFIKNISQL